MRPGLGLALVALLASCGSSEPEEFLLLGLSKSRAAISITTPLTLTGQGFFAEVFLDVDSRKARVDASFRVHVGATELAADSVTRTDSHTLELLLPAGLPEGLQDVSVLAPSGESRTLSGALLVAEPQLFLEDAASGSGSVQTSLVLTIGEKVDLFAVSRWPDGEFFRPEDVTWSLDGAGASFVPGQNSALVTYEGVGKSQLLAQSGSFGSATVEIQSIECVVATNCADTTCRSTTRCDANECTVGAIDRDLDGDGYLDMACGGDDCDDDPGQCGANCFPGNGADFCDGADQDCDGTTDEDPDLNWYADTDLDGLGDGLAATTLCTAPVGFVADNTDCDDTEINCTTDCTDADGDALALCAGDCDDSLATGPTCTTGCSTFFADTDLDGFGDNAAPSASQTCVAGTGFVADNTDCDDSPAGCGASCSPALTESLADSNCTDTFDNDCDTLIDGAEASCSSTPPIAALVISPGLGLTGSLFSGDASASIDLEEPAANLSYEWDWDGDGIFEATGIASTHTFATPGSYEVVLRVEDSAAMVDYATFDLLVVDAPQLVEVTTGVDESDPAATPASPGGTGFSLREAITFSNSTAERQSILVPAGLNTVLASNLPSLADVAGADIVGDGAIVDCNSSAAVGFLTSSDGNGFYGLDLRNCGTLGFGLAGAGDRVARGIVSVCGTGIRMRGAGVEVGPDVEVVLNATGIFIENADALVHDSRIHGNGQAVVVTNLAIDLLFRFNEVYENLQGLDSVCNSGSFHHNVFDAQLGFAFRVSNVVSSTEFANNILNNNGTGISGQDASFSVLDFSLFDSNGTDCNGCTPGANSIFAAPSFIDVGNDDYRLRITSEGVDAGTDLGLDLNGAEPGLFFGSAPDMGATEAQ